MLIIGANKDWIKKVHLLKSEFLLKWSFHKLKLSWFSMNIKSWWLKHNCTQFCTINRYAFKTFQIQQLNILIKILLSISLFNLKFADYIINHSHLHKVISIILYDINYIKCAKLGVLSRTSSIFRESRESRVLVTIMSVNLYISTAETPIQLLRTL